MIQWHPHTTNSAALGSDAFIGATAAIIAGLAAAGSSVAGAEIQAHGASNAAKTQSDAAAQAGAYSRQATDRALGYIQQGQQGIQQAPTYGGVTPFGGGSSGAYGTMARLMGGSAPQGPSMGGMNLPIAQMPQNGMGGGMPAGALAPGGGMVMMVAPNGQQKAVPANQVDHYTAQGARRL